MGQLSHGIVNPVLLVDHGDSDSAVADVHSPLYVEWSDSHSLLVPMVGWSLFCLKGKTHFFRAPEKKPSTFK
jgi:hypothetical protein